MENARPASRSNAGPIAELRRLFRSWQDQFESGLQLCLAATAVLAALSLAIQLPPVDQLEVVAHRRILHWMGPHAHALLASLTLSGRGQPGATGFITLSIALSAAVTVTLALRGRIYSASLLVVSVAGSIGIVRLLGSLLPRPSPKFDYGATRIGAFPSVQVGVGIGTIVAITLLVGRIAPELLRRLTFTVGIAGSVAIIVSAATVDLGSQVIAGCAAAVIWLALLQPFAGMLLEHEDLVTENRQPLLRLGWVPGVAWLETAREGVLAVPRNAHRRLAGRGNELRESWSTMRASRIDVREARKDSRAALKAARMEEKAADKQVRAELKATREAMKKAEALDLDETKKIEASEKARIKAVAAKAKVEEARLRADHEAAEMRTRAEAKIAESQRKQAEIKSAADAKLAEKRAQAAAKLHAERERAAAKLAESERNRAELKQQTEAGLAEQRAQAEAKLQSEQERSAAKAADAERRREDKLAKESAEAGRRQAKEAAKAKSQSKQERPSAAPSPVHVDYSKATAPSPAAAMHRSEQSRAKSDSLPTEVAEQSGTDKPQADRRSTGSKAGSGRRLPFKKQPAEPSPVELAQMASRIASFTRKPRRDSHETKSGQPPAA